MSDDGQFDFSKWNFPEDRIWLHISKPNMIIKITTILPVLIFGLIANYMIIRLIILNRSLRTPTNLLIANMAMANFLILLICPVLFLIDDFYQNYMLGSVGCKMEGFLEGTFLITAVFNLCSVSYDRLAAIVLPSEKRLTMRGSKIVICLTWIAGTLIAGPLAIYRTFKVRKWKNFTEMYCKENPIILPTYWYVLITILVWLPLSVMIICYSVIFYKLDRYEKRNLNREHPLMISYKKTVAKSLFIILIVFVILRLPFTILVVLRDKIVASNNNTVNRTFRTLWYISQYLIFLNAVVNPIIYGYKNDHFRRVYDQTPFCKWYKKAASNSKVTEQSKCCSQFSLNWLKAHKCCFCFKPQDTYNLRNGHQNLMMATIKCTNNDDIRERLSSDGIVGPITDDGFI